MSTAQELGLDLPSGEPVSRSRFTLRMVAGIGIPGVFLLVFLVAGVFAPLIAPRNPGEIIITERLQPPAWEGEGTSAHLLGTDNLGRDIFSRIVYGARISLLVVLVCVPLAALIGTVIGLTAGSRLGLVDKLVMRVVDVQLAMPAILFAILLAAVFGPSLRNVIIIIIVWTWSGYARLVRGEALSLRERDFVLAARSIGAGEMWIMARHIAPNVLNAVVILATLEVSQVILIESALSFLGVGVGLGTPSWGAMVSEGRNYMTIAWWLAGLPGIAILLVSLSGNMAGDWVRDALDPRLRNVR